MEWKGEEKSGGLEHLSLPLPLLVLFQYRKWEEQRLAWHVTLPQAADVLGWPGNSLPLVKLIISNTRAHVLERHSGWDPLEVMS